MLEWRSMKPISHKADGAGLPTRDQLMKRLRGRNRRNADEMDRAIEDRCVRELAVMMCDSSGFSRKTHDYGILQFLAVMIRVYDAAGPIVRRRKGVVVHQGADNLLAVFPDCASAADCALDLHAWLAKHNAGKPEHEAFETCIGIHWGKVLRLKDDAFGDKVNIASKIGEDLASRGETLVTKDVVQRLPARLKTEYLRSTEIGGRLFELHRLKPNAR